jgi:hypothetical protein
MRGVMIQGFLSLKRRGRGAGCGVARVVAFIAMIAGCCGVV